MDSVQRRNTNTFDFSQDAQHFKAQLWAKIKSQMAATSVQELEDDDLEWVSAAGMAVRPEDKPGSP